jgi:hypothetical protein
MQANSGPSSQPSIRLPTSALDDTAVWRAWLSQHLLPAVTCAIELRLTEELPATAQRAASSLGVNARVLRALLEVLRVQDLVASEEDEVFSLSATGRSFLVRGSPTFGGVYLCSTSAAQPLHDRLLAALRSDEESAAPPTRTAARWERGGSHDADDPDAHHRALATVAHMHALHSPTFVRAAGPICELALELCAARPLRVLDAAGGSGCLAVCLAKAAKAAAERVECVIGGARPNDRTRERTHALWTLLCSRSHLCAPVRSSTAQRSMC